ncbi:MAG: SafA/ExsA family spore coat assembly protein [Bacillota bacterium]
MKIHIVQKGDTLWKIAKKYGVNFEELKSMNTQLSNPDLIMPGMKIKVPSGNVAVKKEAPMTMQIQKKEMPMAEHPFAKEKPKAVLGVEDVEDTLPKEPISEKPSKPYIPPVPNVQHPVYTGLDVNNYYTVNNMAMMPQMAPPQLPPKPENVLPDMAKVDEEMYKEQAKSKPYYLPQEQQEEALKDMANMPNVPNMPNMQMPAYTAPNIPNMQMPAYTAPNMPNMQMPAYTAPAMQHPQYGAPQYMVPVSPILPGYGFCPPGPYQPMAMPYGYGPAPNQPYHTAVSPEQYDEDDEDVAYTPNMPYPQAMAPAHYGPGFPVNPYAGVPVSPVLPGYGFNPNQVLGAYGEAPGEDDDYDYENQAQSPNMPYPQAVAPAYAQKQGDCGCGGPAPYANPYQGFPYQQGVNYGYPMAQPFVGYPAQQPYMAPQGYNPYGYNQGQQQMAPGGQMFGMPNYDDRDEEED